MILFTLLHGLTRGLYWAGHGLRLLVACVCMLILMWIVLTHPMGWGTFLLLSLVTWTGSNDSK